MKQFQRLSLSFGLAAAITLFFSGCGPGHHAGHDHGHDHDHSGHHHDHAAHDHGAPAVDQVADAAGLIIIENPTAEQLAAAKPYPLDTCLVAGEKLGEMGDPMVLLVGNQQVKLCCDHCLPELKKNTAELLAKLQP
jgi:hypothetical protein